MVSYMFRSIDTRGVLSRVVCCVGMVDVAADPVADVIADGGMSVVAVDSRLAEVAVPVRARALEMVDMPPTEYLPPTESG